MLCLKAHHEDTGESNGVAISFCGRNYSTRISWLMCMYHGQTCRQSEGHILGPFATLPGTSEKCTLVDTHLGKQLQMLST